MGVENWRIFRYGLGPVFQTLDPDTKISVRYINVY